MRRAAVIAVVMSRVKMPAARPKSVALTASITSSSVSNGTIEIAVSADNRRRDAAELERNRTQADVALQLLANTGAAGKGVEADLLVLDEPSTNLAAWTLHEIDMA